MSVPPVRVQVTVWIEPPASRPGQESTSVSRVVSHSSARGQLVTRDDLIIPCVEEAVEIAAQKVIEMVAAQYPGEVDR